MKRTIFQSINRLRRSHLIICVICGLILLSTPTNAAAPPPNPVLTFLGTELMGTAGKEQVRYLFDVANKSAYPAEMFAPAPDLPPCGENKNSARTWVDVYEQNGKRLNGFCAFSKPEDLGKIWFSLDNGAVPPSWIYIEMHDRKTGTKYKSNLAETTL